MDVSRFEQLLGDDVFSSVWLGNEATWRAPGGQKDPGTYLPLRRKLIYHVAFFPILIQHR